MRSIEKLAPLAVATVALLVSLIVGGAAIWMMVREARVKAAVPALEYVASIKTYDAKGKLIADETHRAERPPLYGLAARLLPPEVTCTTKANQTVCVETTPSPLAAKLSAGLRTLGIGTAISVLFGALAGHLLARAFAAPLRRMADVVSSAARDHAYSFRVEKAKGDLGRMADAVNDLLAEIQQRDVELRRRSTDLESANKDLESFAYSVSHDLRGPLGTIDGFASALETDYSDAIDDEGREYMHWIREGCRQMRELIDGLLQMSRLSRTEVQRGTVDLSSLARSVADSLKLSNPARVVKFEIREGLQANGDEHLLRAVLENLMSNAWKFTKQREEARIEVGQSGGAYFVRDNGAGFDPTQAAKMFRPFQRLHSAREFEGTGIGLATVQKIIERHGGRAWAEGEPGKGATIYFTTA